MIFCSNHVFGEPHHLNREKFRGDGDAFLSNEAIEQTAANLLACCAFSNGELWIYCQNE